MMTPHYFRPCTLDGRKALLERSYRLRYQVYCVERKFLRAEDYPDQMELDRFDPHAIHVGAIDAHGELAGTARVVRPSAIGLPLLEYCAIDPAETFFTPANPRLVEVGRLSVSRDYRRRRSDHPVGAGPLVDRRSGYRGDRRRQQDDVFLTLLKALYQASKRAGATNWVAATEKSLQRMLARRGFPFHQIGPENDSFGVVAPYQMDLQEFEDVIASGRFPALEDFVEGLADAQPAEHGLDDAIVRPGDDLVAAETPGVAL